MKLKPRLPRLSSLLVLLCPVILLALIFLTQRLAIKDEFIKKSRNRSEFLAEICREALAGNDFLFLEKTLITLQERDGAIKEIYLTFPGTIIQSPFSSPAPKSIFRLSLESQESSEQIPQLGLLFTAPGFPTYLPLIVEGETVATLNVVYDTTAVHQQIRDLLIALAGSAVLLLLLNSFLLSREAKTLEQLPAPAELQTTDQQGMQSLTKDPFALPQIGHASALELNPDVDLTKQYLTSEEDKIIQSLASRKKLIQLAHECAFDDLLIFELVNGLMSRRIIKAYPLDDTTVNLKSLLK